MFDSHELVVRVLRLLRVVGEVAGERDVVLTDAEATVLLLLEGRPAMTARQLSNQTGKDPSTTSRCLAGLYPGGLVKAELDPLDGRKRLLYLGDTGRAIAEEAIRRAREQGVVL